MARSTRKSIAGSAVSAARKALSRGSAAKKASGAAAAPAKKSAAKKTAPAKKSAAKKTAPAKKSAAKKASPAKKSAAKKTAPATKTAAKTAAKKAAPAKKTAATTTAAPATKAAAKKAPAKTPTTKAAPVSKAPAKKTSADKAPVRKTVAKKTTAKKTTAKKAASRVSALVVSEGEGAWTKAEVKEVLAELNEERDRVAATLADQEAELAGLMRDSGDGAGQDPADMGATSFERDHELIVANNEREKLAQIDRALGRIADGTYGSCESCGNPIGKRRLMAFPRATLCMSCKQREERR